MAGIDERLTGGGWQTHPWVAAGSRQIRVGITGGPRADWPALLAFVREAEALGVDSYWMADHPLRRGTPECWTQLAALAVTTERIRLGSLVSCVYYRHPALLARQAADVDRLSGGRLLLGMGIGDYAWEFDMLGLAMPPAPQRLAALEEAMHIVRGLWRGEPFTLQGEHFSVRDAQIDPPPVQQPHVPLLIAGGGERVTLRQVADYADMSNFGAGEDVGRAFTLEDIRRKFAALDAHCARRGRPPSSVLRSNWTVPVCAPTSAALERKLTARFGSRPDSLSLAAGTPADLIPHYQTLVDAGMRYFTAYIAPGDHETLRLLMREVMPALRVPEPASQGEA